MFQTIGSTLTLIALVWAFSGQPAHASLTYNGAASTTGAYSTPPNAGAALAADGVNFAPPAR